MTPSTRAQIITRRTYNRPLRDDGTLFETWEQTVDRVIGHQEWLWQRAKGCELSNEEYAELVELRDLMLAREVSLSGRVLWLGGTQVAKTRESSAFNCSFSKTATVHDVVDHFWLLLQGCGVGGLGQPGILSGFTKPVKTIEVIRSVRTIEEFEQGVRGEERNIERYYIDEEGDRVWHLQVGDSAEAWAKALGKILAMKKPVDRIILDFSAIRAAGIRLRGYGWISSGDETISEAFVAICKLLSERAGELLSRIDLLDIENHIGTTLSSRRSAEIMLCPYDDPEWEAFALAKKGHYLNGKKHRGQSNNSLLFERKPSKAELYGIFGIMQMGGGSEPGFINAAAARKRAPWFVGVNPCAEILLGDKSFCNLVEIDLGKFNGRFEELKRAIWIAARANYRQTCVNLKDGILQDSWHELNEYLRLCGVGLTGIVRSEYINPEDLQTLRESARAGAFSMADELGLPRPKAVTTVKPSGTLSKIMDTTEGVHKPLGRYIFNWVKFSKLDPLIPTLVAAGYRTMDDPYTPDGMLVCFPVRYDDVEFETKTVEGVEGVRTIEVNTETAVEQLERYKLLMDNYVDHNCSITVSYDPSEVPAIVDWLDANWDTYVGVSFIYRNDPTKTAADLGYPYLPQEVVDAETFYEYADSLVPIDVESSHSFAEIDDGGCSAGGCPIK